VEDILKFRGGVSLEGSSSLESCAESLSEDSFGMIGCSGLKVYSQGVGKVAAAHGCGFLSLSVEILRITVFEHIELPAKLPDDFLRSNKRNINQSVLAEIFHNPDSIFLAENFTGVTFGVTFVTFYGVCFIKPISGNRYGPGVSSRASQGGRTHDPRSCVCDVCDVLWNSTITKKNVSRSIIFGQIPDLSVNVPHGT